jgi:cysteine desulfurase/selenocysteine lyase
MITTVSLSGYELADPPIQYEAGTPPLAEVIGLGAAAEYIQDIGVSAIHSHYLHTGVEISVVVMLPKLYFIPRSFTD